MKKMILVLLITLLLGCEDTATNSDKAYKNKNLTCSISEELGEYYTAEERYYFIFNSDGKELREYTANLIFNYGKQFSDENRKESYNQILQQCNIYNQYDGIDCQISENSQQFIVNIKVNISELTADKINFGDREKELYNNYTYEQLKYELESSGRTCK